MTSRSAQSEPIQSSWKISEVISRYPQLIDVLASLNPTFRLLRNPVARRVQARLVTVAQAAQIARIEPDDMVTKLNDAIGISTSAYAVTAGDCETADVTAEPAWVAGARVAAEVDVRALQREGKEPFSAIMAGAREARSGEVLRVRSSFEPVPLYQVLGQRGFEPFTRQHADDDWEVLFLNSGMKPNPAATASSSPTTEYDSPAWEAPDAVITIDVSELVPPEPLIRIMEALEALPAGSRLLVHHVRRPMHLYPQLDQTGYRHATHEIAPGKVEILIEKPSAVR